MSNNALAHVGGKKYEIKHNSTASNNNNQVEKTSPFYKKKTFWVAVVCILLILVGVPAILSGAGVLPLGTIIPAITQTFGTTVSISAGWTMPTLAAISCYVGGGLFTLIGLMGLAWVAKTSQTPPEQQTNKKNNIFPIKDEIKLEEEPKEKTLQVFNCMYKFDQINTINKDVEKINKYGKSTYTVDVVIYNINQLRAYEKNLSQMNEDEKKRNDKEINHLTGELNKKINSSNEDEKILNEKLSIINKRNNNGVEVSNNRATSLKITLDDNQKNALKNMISENAGKNHDTNLNIANHLLSGFSYDIFTFNNYVDSLNQDILTSDTKVAKLKSLFITSITKYFTDKRNALMSAMCAYVNIYEKNISLERSKYEKNTIDIEYANNKIDTALKKMDLLKNSFTQFSDKEEIKESSYIYNTVTERQYKIHKDFINKINGVFFKNIATWNEKKTGLIDKADKNNIDKKLKIIPLKNLLKQEMGDNGCMKQVKVSHKKKYVKWEGNNTWENNYDFYTFDRSDTILIALYNKTIEQLKNYKSLTDKKQFQWLITLSWVAPRIQHFNWFKNDTTEPSPGNFKTYAINPYYNGKPIEVLSTLHNKSKASYKYENKKFEIENVNDIHYFKEQKILSPTATIQLVLKYLEPEENNTTNPLL